MLFVVICRSNSSTIPLTGDSQADEDIKAFIRARQNILQQKGSFVNDVRFSSQLGLFDVFFFVCSVLSCIVYVYIPIPLFLPGRR